MKKLRPRFVVPLGVLAGFLFISIIVMVVVPINMDESIHYHPLSCDFYENAKSHIFREPCDGFYDFNFLGLKLKRAFHYRGSLSSYIYSIFFRIYPRIITQRLVGILFLLLLVGTVVLLGKENKASVLVLFGLSYPIIYQVVNDTGPVRYGLWVYFLTPLLARYILQSQQIYGKVLLNVLLGVILFLAVEDQTFFLYLVPSVAFLTLAYTQDEINGTFLDSLKVLVKELWLGAAIFGICTSSYLLLSKTVDGRIYLAVLRGSVSKRATWKHLLAFFMDFQEFSHRVYEYNGWRQVRLINLAFSLSRKSNGSLESPSLISSSIIK